MPAARTPRGKRGRGRKRSTQSPFSPAPGTEADGIGDNDDDAEREANRRAKADDDARRNAASPFPKKSPGVKRTKSRPKPAAAKKMSDDAMVDLYSNCIKLSADNVRLTARDCS